MISGFLLPVDNRQIKVIESCVKVLKNADLKHIAVKKLLIVLQK